MSNRPGQRGATLKQGAVIALVRDMIADGTLLPGAPVPPATELAVKAGCCARTCRAALRRLLKDGTLTQGPSPTARLRVAIDGTGRAAVRVPLSSALAALRHSAGLTQPELATLAGVTVTTVGHAETGRVWQARHFWERADRVLGATGVLLRLYDERQAGGAAVAPEEASQAEPEEPAPVAPVLPASVTITPDGVAVLWPDGTETLARPPGLT